MPRNATDAPLHLTPRQLQLLRAVDISRRNRCCSPTVAELSQLMHISRSTVFEHIGELRRKGLLSMSSGKARCSTLTSQGQRLLRKIGQAEGESRRREVGSLPLVGQVAAGVPVEAVENRDLLSLQSCFGTGDDLFALEVAGDSMIEDDIRPGDYVICRRRPQAQNGDLVVAAVDGSDATLKRFHKEPNAVRLDPANANYEPVVTDSCRIEGIVVGLVRRF